MQDPRTEDKSLAGPRENKAEPGNVWVKIIAPAPSLGIRPPPQTGDVVEVSELQAKVLLHAHVAELADAPTMKAVAPLDAKPEAEREDSIAQPPAVIAPLVPQEDLTAAKAPKTPKPKHTQKPKAKAK